MEFICVFKEKLLTKIKGEEKYADGEESQKIICDDDYEAYVYVDALTGEYYVEAEETTSVYTYTAVEFELMPAEEKARIYESEPADFTEDDKVLVTFTKNKYLFMDKRDFIKEPIEKLNEDEDKSTKERKSAPKKKKNIHKKQKITTEKEEEGEEHTQESEIIKEEIIP
jgi:hypothetical protein